MIAGTWLTSPRPGQQCRKFALRWIRRKRLKGVGCAVKPRKYEELPKVTSFQKLLKQSTAGAVDCAVKQAQLTAPAPNPKEKPMKKGLSNRDRVLALPYTIERGGDLYVRVPYQEPATGKWRDKSRKLLMMQRPKTP